MTAGRLVPGRRVEEEVPCVKRPWVAWMATATGTELIAGLWLRDEGWKTGWHLLKENGRWGNRATFIILLSESQGDASTKIKQNIPFFGI